MPGIAVISDTHGALTAKNVEKLFDGDSRVITLGDITNGELKIIKKAYHFLGGVRGNCDINNRLPESDTIETSSIRIFLSHAPTRVKIISRAEDHIQGYDVVLFGHLHKRYYAEKDGIVYFSPGSYSIPKDNFGPSAGAIEINAGRCEFRFVDVVL